LSPGWVIMMMTINQRFSAPAAFGYKNEHGLQMFSVSWCSE
jgi:hypothetical protein